MSIEVTIPAVNANTKTIQSWTTSVNTSTLMVRATAAYAVWVHIKIRRLSNRSASTPPKAPNRSTGPNESAALRPSAVPLPVSFSTSQAMAVKFIHVPVADTSCPARYRRKFRDVRSEANVRPTAASTRGLKRPDPSRRVASPRSG